MARLPSTRGFLVGLCVVAVLVAVVSPVAGGVVWAVLPSAATFGVPDEPRVVAPADRPRLLFPPLARLAAPRGPPAS
jgi:hypothetical protein